MGKRERKSHSAGRSAILEVLPGGEQTEVASVFRRVSQTGAPERIEAYFAPSERWYEATVTASDGGLTVFFRDMTRRRSAEEEVRKSSARALEILDSVPQIIWSSDADGQCEYLSPQWYAFTGRRRGADFGLGWAEVLHPEDAGRAQQSWQAAMAAGARYEDEFRIRDRDGGYRWTLVQAAPQRDEQGCVRRWFGTCTDIHDRVLAQQALERSEALNRSILNSSPDCIKLLEADGTILFVNPLGPRLLEIDDATPLIGACWFDLLSPDVAEAAKTAVAKACSGLVQHLTVMQPTTAGREKWFHILVSPVRSAAEVQRVVVVARDITEQKKAEAALATSEAMHRSVLEASPDCIKVMALDGALEIMNSPGLCAMELDSFEQVKGRSWLELWPSDVQPEVRSALEAARGGETARFTAFCPTAKETPKWWDVVVTPMCNADGRVDRILSISRDITATREAAEQLRQASEEDALTGLPNRRTFQAHLQAATIRAMESGGMVGLLLVDLDHFKHVNDTLGHSAGDYLLRTFAHRMKGSVRTSDFVARLGGDEFAVILEAASEGDLLRAGESILARLQLPVKIEGHALSAGASIGGALFPRDASTAQELLKNADTALYALKTAGRGGTKMFHNYMREEAQQVASQLSLARIAVSETSIVPYYQPKVNLKTGSIVGFEALLRWEHPRRGVQEPDTILEAFKDYELASKIGELMQNKVFSHITQLRGSGMELGQVSLNAAPAEFLRDDYAERLLWRLQHHEVSASSIEIEVTEHAFVDRSSELVARALTELKNAGVRISLDDFGTGHSSLSHLRDFPVDVVKIDRSFVDQMLDDQEIAAIVRAVIHLAHSLSIDVVAEGIETSDQMDLLKTAGCTFGQGWLFGRPAAPDEIARILGKAA